MVNNATPNLGDPVTFTVTLTNSGPDTASNIQVRDTIPAGLSNVVTNVSTGSFTNGVWSIPSLLSGTNATLTITATVNNTTTITNTAEVIASDTIDPDSTPNNNLANEDDQDSATVTAIAPAPSTPPELLLVKRITAINGNSNLINNAQDLNAFNDDPNDTNDNNPNWPDRNIYLKGGFSLVGIQPGDELEYTVYFISSGGETALNVSLCDILPEETIFLNDGFGSDRGIAFFNTITFPLPNPPVATSLTNNSGDDEGQFFIPGSLSIPAFCSGDTANNLSTSGAVVLNINDLPNATAPGNPANSYGFFRFKVTVE
ncbi:MAG: DUF11 domain-containing protein [Prochloraceae cyanobacterium]|nr:DUF11 domain-containing protein [Prochloraceae cyanobacterium]